MADERPAIRRPDEDGTETWANITETAKTLRISKVKGWFFEDGTMAGWLMSYEADSDLAKLRASGVDDKDIELVNTRTGEVATHRVIDLRKKAE